jgi:hypothetical protein
MKAFLNGVEGGLIKLAKDTDNVINGIILSDQGGQHDLSTATVDLILQTRPDRSDGLANAVLVAAAAVLTATDGTFTVTIADTALTFGPGRYYGFIRRTLAADIQFANKYTIIDIV